MVAEKAKKLENKTNTRERILLEAAKLFATKGYEGTSIRQISKNAEVSLASTNYHFNSKADLYKEILLAAGAQMNQRFEELSRNAESLTELLLSWFDDLCSNGSTIKNVYQMIISEEVVQLNLIPEEFSEMFKSGPPGVAVLEKFIIRECEKRGYHQVSQTAIDWMVMVVMNSLMQWAIKESSNCLLKVIDQLSRHKMENIHLYIKLLSDSLIDQITSGKIDKKIKQLKQKA